MSETVGYREQQSLLAPTEKEAAVELRNKTQARASEVHKLKKWVDIARSIGGGLGFVGGVGAVISTMFLFPLAWAFCVIATFGQLISAGALSYLAYKEIKYKKMSLAEFEVVYNMLKSIENPQKPSNENEQTIVIDMNADAEMKPSSFKKLKSLLGTVQPYLQDCVTRLSGALKNVGTVAVKLRWLLLRLGSGTVLSASAVAAVAEHASFMAMNGMVACSSFYDLYKGITGRREGQGSTCGKKLENWVRYLDDLLLTENVQSFVDKAGVVIDENRCQA